VATGGDEDGVFTLCCQASISGGSRPVILPHEDPVTALYKDWLNGERLIHLAKHGSMQRYGEWESAT